MSLGKIIKLIVACLVVGYVVQFFELTPQKVLENFGETIAALYAAAQSLLGWAADYIITGALIVLPIWGIATLANYLNNRFSGKSKNS